MTLIVVVCSFSSCFESHELYTDNIEDYNTEKYPMPEFLFLDKIPSYADVVAFYYYDYWYEQQDYYLELKFESAENLDTYVSELKLHYLNNAKDWNRVYEEDWIVEQKNPYNENYEELICTVCRTYKTKPTGGEQAFTGYQIWDDELKVYKCNFGIISYSYEDLTVIQSRASGWFQENVNKYLPKYFSRFNVPITEKHERLVYFNYIDKAKE